MKRFSMIALILLFVSGGAVAQSSSDSCHVYLMDVKAAKKAYETLDSTASQEAQAKALSSVLKILGEFSTVVREEELTTRSYPFPDSKLVVTASVFYTDESMPGGDSIMLGIAVSDKPLKDVLSTSNNAVAEVSYNDSAKIVRVRKFLDVNGRSYLIGLQCNLKSKAGGK